MKNWLIVLMVILLCLNVSAAPMFTVSGFQKFKPEVATIYLWDNGNFSTVFTCRGNETVQIKDVTLKNTVDDVECVVDLSLPLNVTCPPKGPYSFQLEATSCTKQTPEIESYAHEIQVNITYTLLNDNTTYKDSGRIHLDTIDYAILANQKSERMKKLPETILFFSILIFFILTYFRIKYKKNPLMRVIYVIYFVFWMLAIILSYISTNIMWSI